MATVTRDAAGVHIDSAELRWWREIRGLSRAQLAVRVTDLGWDDPDNDGKLTLKRDSVHKFEHPSTNPDYRRYPRPITNAAICVVLRITPAHLMPGQGHPDLPPVERLGRAEDEFRLGLVAYAGEHHLPVLTEDDSDYCLDTVSAYVRHLAGVELDSTPA